MEALRYSKVLVVNQKGHRWEYAGFIPAYRSIIKVFQDKAKILQYTKEDGKLSACELYTWDEWVTNWSDAVLAAQEMERNPNGMVRSPGITIKVPEIIVLNKYQKRKYTKAILTRRAVFQRDQYVCQYCGIGFSPKDLSIDHINPRCRGGTTEWKNVATACKRCNNLKGSMLLKDCGMTLLSDPIEPVYSAKNKPFKRVPKSWEDFISDMYWNVELEK